MLRFANVAAIPAEGKAPNAPSSVETTTTAAKYSTGGVTIALPAALRIDARMGSRRPASATPGPPVMANTIACGRRSTERVSRVLAIAPATSPATPPIAPASAALKAADSISQRIFAGWLNPHAWSVVSDGPIRRNSRADPGTSEATQNRVSRPATPQIKRLPLRSIDRALASARSPCTPSSALLAASAGCPVVAGSAIARTEPGSVIGPSVAMRIGLFAPATRNERTRVVAAGSPVTIRAGMVAIGSVAGSS